MAGDGEAGDFAALVTRRAPADRRGAAAFRGLGFGLTDFLRAIVYRAARFHLPRMNNLSSSARVTWCQVGRP